MTPILDDGDVRLYQGDAIDVLRGLPEGSVDCCVTSPPYYGLRDYGVEGQIGLEDTPDAFVARLVDVFREVRRVLADHGTCWVNMGDSYASAPVGTFNGGGAQFAGRDMSGIATSGRMDKVKASGLNPKNLLMMPARVALALQADGWWLRSDIIWAKPNPMPESVRDRPTSAHEHIFLLTKAPRYYWDAEAVREPAVGANHHDLTGGRYSPPGQNGHTGSREGEPTGGRNVRNVWTIATEPTPEAHFATYPTELVRRCLAAGCPERVCATCGVPSERVVESERLAPASPSGAREIGRWNGGGESDLGGRVLRETTGWTDCGHDAYRPGVCLDPFIGSGTTARVARGMGLHAIGIDLNPEYLAIAARRLQQLTLLGGAT